MSRQVSPDVEKPELLFVVGPTASGKSDVAVAIAEAVGSLAEIINTDSVQFFAGVDIGAAKPGPELLARAKHHLVGHRPIGSAYTAGQFREEALALIAGERRHWLAVGGSGFYVQALVKGMFDVPEVAEETKAQILRESAGDGGWSRLYSELAVRDPAAAAKIASADRYRIGRALEILRSYDGTLSEVRAKFAATTIDQPFRVRKIGLTVDRDVLRERIRLRTQRMIARGLVDEVQSLRGELARRGLDADWAPLRSVGYREVGEYLDGRLARAELEPEIVISTMQLAKRQMTWFKRDAAITWFASETATQKAIAAGVAAFT